MSKENHLADGCLLNNRYRIIRFIASGGFGNTYEAEDTRFGSHVAIKELFISGVCKREDDSKRVTISVSDNVAPFRKQKERFIKEAERLRLISHPNVVKVSDYFEENGTAYYVMDYVRGCSLSELREKGELTEIKVVQYINQVLEALEAVHDKGLLHLDIKPSNIMLDENHRVILIDFGASKQIETVDGKSVSVSTGIMGTPGYYPIEQSGSTKDKLGAYTDIYAIGATLYNLITGNTPPTSSELLAAGLPDFKASECVANAIRQAMRPNFTERPQSVADFRTLLNGDKITDRKLPVGDKTEKLDKKKSGKRGVKLTFILLSVILAGVIAWLLINPMPESTTNDSLAISDSANKTIDSANIAQQTVETPTPAETANDDTEAENGYSDAYSDALSLFNSQKYEECKSLCKRLLRQYTKTEQKQQLNQLITKCDSAIATATEVEMEQQYRTEITSVNQLFNNKKYAECKTLCQSLLQKYPKYASEINIIIINCNNAIAEIERMERMPDNAVDLGLSVYWADCNVGASTPSGYGNYYTFNQASSAARSMGGNWRLPTKSELEELERKCTFTWTTQGGHNGCRVTGPNGNYIFLPAAGTDHSYYVGLTSVYWSSTPYNSDRPWVLSGGESDDLSRVYHGVMNNSACSVRPVCDK